MFMEKMHHASNSGIAKAIFALISVSFFVTGMYGYLGGAPDSFAVKVNGEEVSQQQFQTLYNNEFQRTSQVLGAAFATLASDPEFSQQIKKQVLDRLIEEKLLNQYVAELKLTQSDEQIKQEIIRSPLFKKDGKFDNELYQQILRNNNMTPDAYAQYLREASRLAQLGQGLSDISFLTPASQQQFTELFFQQRQVRIAPLSLAAFLDKQQVTEQEIQAYYQQNQKQFILPEVVKVQYIDLNKTAIEKNIQLTEKDFHQYYQDHKSQFMSQGQQQLAHIQFDNEKDAQKAYQELQQGGDFASLAKQLSKDRLSAENGGDLGWINDGELPKEFEQAALLTEVGKFTAPTKVNNQYHIILVKDRKSAEQLPFEKVRKTVEEQAQQERLSSQFYAIEKSVAEKAFEDQNSLKTAAEIAGINMVETEYFSRNNVPSALNFPVVTHAIFDGEIAQGNINSEPMNVAEQHSIVVRVLDHKAQSQKSLEQARAEIENLLKQQKAKAEVLAQANQIVESLTSDQQQKLPAGIHFGSQEKWVYAKNDDGNLANAIFAMKLNEKDGKSYQVAQTSKGDVVIIELVSIQPAELDEQSKVQFNTAIQQQAARDLQLSLLAALKNRAKIEINDSFINQQGE